MSVGLDDDTDDTDDTDDSKWKDVPPNLFLAAVDGREHWCEEIKDKTNHIYCVWLYDKNVDWHLCSFDVSRECYYIGNIVILNEEACSDLTDEQREALIDKIEEEDRPYSQWEYFDTSIDEVKYRESVEWPEGMPWQTREEYTRGFLDIAEGISESDYDWLVIGS